VLGGPIKVVLLGHCIVHRGCAGHVEHAVHGDVCDAGAGDGGRREWLRHIVAPPHRLRDRAAS
jgi:hypothetical protein